MGVGSSGDSVIVVIDANRNRNNIDALKWALNNVVRPKDTVIVLGVLCDDCKKTPCFPFDVGFGIWERLEFSSRTDKSPKLLQEEITRTSDKYQCALQPYYIQCKRNEVKLEMKLTAGFSPKNVTINEAQQNANTRWIVLDSHLKKDRFCIYSEVGCNIAVIKHNNVATIMPSLAAESERLDKTPVNAETAAPVSHLQRPHEEELNASKEEKAPRSCAAISSWYPLSFQPVFPREFIYAELETITKAFAEENIVFEEENLKVYRGIFMEAPVLVKSFSGDHEQFWAELKILSRVRHRNILNLVGYCCVDNTVFLLIDHPCKGSLDLHLQCDELAKNLSWSIRWDIALGIGACLRYLHEECLYGPILHLAVFSSHILVAHDFSAMLTNFSSAKWLEDDGVCNDPLSVDRPTITTLGDDEGFSLDVYAYGLLLLELITGQKALGFDTLEDCQKLVDWALPLLENGYLSQLMDQRLNDLGEAKEVHYMASAALLCLKNASGHWPSMSEVVAVVRGDRFLMSQWRM